MTDRYAAAGYGVDHRSARLDRILATLLGQAPELEAAAVVSFDGLPMASALPHGMDEDRVAAMSAALLSLGERAAQGLGRGDLNQVYVEGESGTVFLVSADDEAVLVAVGARGAKVGLLLFEVRQAAEAVASALRQQDSRSPYEQDSRGTYDERASHSYEPSRAYDTSAGPDPRTGPVPVGRTDRVDDLSYGDGSPSGSHGRPDRWDDPRDGARVAAGADHRVETREPSIPRPADDYRGQAVPRYEPPQHEASHPTSDRWGDEPAGDDRWLDEGHGDDRWDDNPQSQPVSVAVGGDDGRRSEATPVNGAGPADRSWGADDRVEQPRPRHRSGEPSAWS
jgi:predicted regulator of Ras-like GTPase activity (Roadblock/LC7/MglB family)